MRFLDTREQKTPRYFHKKLKTIPGTLPAGDFLSGEGNPYKNNFKGIGIEFKLSLSDQQNGDYGIHTEPIERFHDECANKMKPFMINNPDCDFHAIWWVEREVSNHEKEMWDHYCYQYYIWGHVVHSEVEFFDLIHRIERGDYVRDKPFIKRSHEEPTILAKMLRQFPGVSSEAAIKFAKFRPFGPLGWYNIPEEWANWEGDIEAFDTIFGTKKNGESYKLWLKFCKWLETGAEP